METQSQVETKTQKRMLPPPPGKFQDREELIKHVREFGSSQGYVVTIKKSRKDRRVILGCDRGGVYRNRRKIDESKRKRKACSRLINCPFEVIGKREDDIWVLTIRNGDHNHEPLRDMSDHPCSRRFTEEEVRQIKLMTEAGVRPRQVLKVLKQSNPELQSTPRQLYNLKAKIRQGNLSEKCFKSWRPNRSSPVTISSSRESLDQNNQKLKVPNFIGGKFVDSQGSATIDTINPATQEVVSQVPVSLYEEFKDAVNAAKQAFPSWKNTPITTRQHIMFKLLELIHRDIDKLAMNIIVEQGKTLKSAHADVLRGLEVVEHACGMATLQVGEFVPNASNGIDTYSIREPLGVCAGICPFNYPAIIPLWMFPIAITCGNTFVLKPCEKNPGASMILAALAKEAGLPDGVLNVIHGTNDIVNYICDDEDIKALSFIGSTTSGLYTYARAAARGKRVQSNTGGKNLAVVMPDANVDATLNALVAAGFGAAGQRCMSLSTAIFVGGSVPCRNITSEGVLATISREDELVKRAKTLKVNAGIDPDADIGPVISKEVKDWICRAVQSGVDSGARLLLDGRYVSVLGYEKGSFVGPTILCDVTVNMECYKEEIFGPLLLCMKADSIEEAIDIVNRNRSVNGASIFTTSGYAARKFQNEIVAGLVGVNVPVPVATPCPIFNGSTASFGNDLNLFGKAGMHFYTQIKTVAQQWRDLPFSSEMDTTTRGMSSLLPLSSGRDSPRLRISSAVSLASESNSPGHRVEREIQNSGISSMPSTTDGDLSSEEASLTMPLRSEINLPNQRLSVGTSPVTEPDLHRQGVPQTTHQPHDRVYTGQASQWTETSSLTSQGTEHVRSSPEGIFMPSASQIKGVADPTSKRTEIAMTLTHDSLYMPASHKNENMVSVSLKNENMPSASHRTDVTARTTTDRIYMLATSHLNETMGQAYQRTDASMFPPSERMYLAPAAQRNDMATTQRNDAVLNPTSKSIYMSAPAQRNDNMTSTSHRGDAMALNSERIYMPPMVQRNASMPPSERLYMPAASRAMYTPNSIISMDDFPSQGPSVTLPTSRRM